MATVETTRPTPLVELRDIRVAFGGVHAVDGVTIDLYPGEIDRKSTRLNSSHT